MDEAVKCNCGGEPKMQYYGGNWRTYAMKCPLCGEEKDSVCFESEAIRVWNEHIKWLKDFDECL